MVKKGQAPNQRSIKHLSEQIKHTILTELIRLSVLATGLSSPNPPVACVITDLNGHILTSGHTSAVGGYHAERNAYLNSKNKLLPRQHIVYVTLEPCSHTGRTPPCADLIIEHQPQKIVYGLRDANPLVRKRDSLQLFAEQKILYEQDKQLQQIAESFLTPFFRRMSHKQPSVIIKTAVSAEGYFATEPPIRTPLSCPASHYFSNLLRSRLDAILVGPKTVAVDIPALDFKEKPLFKSDENPIDYQPPFWSSLLQGYDHGKPTQQYQPLRCFLLGHVTATSQEFLHKQTSLNDKYHQKQVVFFIMEDSYKQWQDHQKSLQEISDGRVFSLKKNHLYEQIMTELYRLGVSLLMVEGGNLLYREFSRVLHKSDTILQIQTPVKIEHGHKPQFSSQPTHLQTYRVGRDLWQVATV